MMKVIAMYLPQFHQVKENDEWWGEGFTDWVSAKSASPLFEGHYQPRIPKNRNYYDLLDKKTMAWQAALMHQYGVDGLCIYHYWFKDGKQILERPAENLLRWKNVEISFCFSWANETWARSWSNIKKKNVWMNKNETPNTGDENGVLLKQEYGNMADWEKHLKYLIPFFKDSRYIKIENKPVFMIYQAADIDCIGDMLAFWREKITQFGFDGVYIIGAHCNAKAGKVVDAELCEEPPGGLRDIFEENRGKAPFRVQYKDVWDRILQEGGAAAHTYYGGFVGYDDTPRRGNNGIVVENATPRVFGNCLAELMAKNAAYGSNIVFINAWNEWGEGMYLEPDEVYGTQFLEAISYAKKKFPSLLPKYTIKSGNEYITYLRSKAEKFEKYLNLMDRWMTLREKGGSIVKKLKQRGVQSVLIYGYGILGRHLLHELLDSEIKVLGVIDKRSDGLSLRTAMYLPSDELPVCDAIIVTAIYFYYEIKQDFSGDKRVLLNFEELIDP